MEPVFLIAEAAAGQQTGGGWQMLAVYGLLFAGMWFLLIAPQRKKQKNQIKMIEGLKPGDRVVTTCGIVGTICNVKGSMFVLQIADDTKVEIFRSYIQTKLDKKAKSGKTDSAELG
jgi:preprotein translocase subunit YajC